MTARDGRSSLEFDKLTGHSPIYGSNATGPIAHYRIQDRVARQFVVTGSDELHQALVAIRARQAGDALVPDAPELRTAMLSPDERKSYKQALRQLRSIQLPRTAAGRS